MTSSPPLAANGVSPAPLAAFRAFLEQQRPSLAEALQHDLVERATYYRSLPDELRAQRVGEAIDGYLAGLEHPEELDDLNQQQLETIAAHELDLDYVLQLVSIYRQQFVRVSAQAIEMRIPAAAAGLAALMELFDRRARAFMRFFQDRLRLFETLVDNSPDGIGVSSLDGRQIHPNPAFRALLGYGDDLIGVHFSEYVETDPLIMQQLAEQGFWQGISTYRRKDGSTLRCHSTIFIIPDAQGQPIALGGVVRDIGEQLRAEEELKRQSDELRTFFALAENAPDGIVVADSSGSISYANQALRTLLGYDTTMVGAQIADRLASSPELLEEVGQQIFASGVWRGTLDYRRRDGSIVRCHGSSFLIKGADGGAGVIATIVRDLTEQQRAEQERLDLQEQVIAAQQAALRELSTPLIPLADGVVAMPLIGSIDSARAQQVVEELLHGVSTNRAKTAIIDITGVPVVDTQVAGALVRAAQAVELLGARVVLTGIRPEVAQTLVGIGVSLGSIVTRSRLQDGITHALDQRGR